MSSAKNCDLITFTDKERELIRKTVCAECTDDEAHLFIRQCERSGLDPMAKLIMPLHTWNSQAKRKTMSIIVRIDGLRLIAERTGTYCPGMSPKFVYKEDGSLDYVEAYARKKVGDTWLDISHVVYFEEYVKRDKSGAVTGMWKTMPRSQTAKCAEAALLRKGWPQECSGLYAGEEMDQAKNIEVEEDHHQILEALLSTHGDIEEMILDRCKVDSVADIPGDKIKVIIKWAQDHINKEVGVDG